MASTPAPVAEENEDEALKDAEGITEIVKLDPSRIDGVFAPANGAPFLLIKSIANTTGGAVMTATATETETDVTGEEEAALTPEAEAAKGTETPDCTAAEEAVKDAAPTADDDDENEDDDSDDDAGDDAKKAAEPSPEALAAARTAYETARREYETAEPTTKGALDPTDFLRARADWSKWRELGKAEGLDGTREGRDQWVSKHIAEDAPAVELDAEVIKTETEVYKRDIDTATRRRLASEGKALSDGSYPIETKGDLGNAAHLARTGHGNVSGAKRLIARRAKELGVTNPLSDDSGGGAASKAGEAPLAQTAPDPVATQALEDFSDTLGKAAAAGLISDEALEAIVAKIPGVTLKTSPPLPAGTTPAGAHREPDGTTTVEQLEPQAGLPTDHDTTGDNVPVSVDANGTIPPANANTDIMAVGKAAPYAVKRMHDALCCAYDEDDVVAAYPALKSILDAVDGAWFTEQAAAKQAAGKAKKADRLAALAKAATDLKTADPAAIADARAGLRKAFTDAYPDTKVRPQDRVAPGSYTRPYLSAGHAAEHANGAPSAAPPSTHVPEPEQFQRGNLTAGHQTPSPADHGPNNPHPPGSAGHDYYTTAEQQMAGAAMRSIHDHIASTFAGCCPMAPAREAFPDPGGMGATSVPAKKVPMSMGGIPTVGKETTAADATATAPEPAKEKGVSKKQLMAALREASEAGARAALAAMKDTTDGAAVQTLVAEQVRAALADRDSQIAALKSQVEELGSQPDPAQAPVRGQMSRPEPAPAPVEKRSLIDEARAAQVAKAEQERAGFAAYMRMQAEQNPDPKVRTRAEEVLRAMPAP